MPGAGGGRLTSIAQRHRRGLLVAVVGLSVVVPGVSAHAATPPTPPTPPTVAAGSDPTTTSAEETKRRRRRSQRSKRRSIRGTDRGVEGRERCSHPTRRRRGRRAGCRCRRRHRSGTAADHRPAADADGVRDLVTGALRRPRRRCAVRRVAARVARLPPDRPDDWFGVSSVHAVRSLPARQRPVGGRDRRPDDGPPARHLGRRWRLRCGHGERVRRRTPGCPPTPAPAAASCTTAASSGCGPSRRTAPWSRRTLSRAPPRAVCRHLQRVLPLDVHVLDRQPGREVALHGPLRLRAPTAGESGSTRSRRSSACHCRARVSSASRCPAAACASRHLTRSGCGTGPRSARRSSFSDAAGEGAGAPAVPNRVSTSQRRDRPVTSRWRLTSRRPGGWRTPRCAPPAWSG